MKTGALSTVADKEEDRVQCHHRSIPSPSPALSCEIASCARPPGTPARPTTARSPTTSVAHLRRAGARRRRPYRHRLRLRVGAGKAAVGQYGISEDRHIDGLRRLVEGGARRAARGSPSRSPIGEQPAAAEGPRTRRPGAVAARRRSRCRTAPSRPREIEETIADFAAAAVRAREAGFDAVQLHFAHGYLGSQFLSPLTNHRTDEWGGSPEKRRRFHIEVLRAMRRAVGDDFPVWAKLGLVRRRGRTLARRGAGRSEGDGR